MSLLKMLIVVLNYNNAGDTIHAIESITRAINSSNHSLLVIDNASTDNSTSLIESSLAASYQLRRVDTTTGSTFDKLPTVHMIQSPSNNGYAAGNNIGIRAAMNDPSINLVWILNNDIEIASDCILKIEEALEKKNNDKTIWGTLLVNYDDRATIQGLSGRYFPLLAKTKLRLPNYPLSKLNAALIDNELRKSNYLIGASLLFNISFFDQVGLFNEDYFLYAEEIDIFLRGKKNGFKKEIIPAAIVYHKEGGTTSQLSSIVTMKKSPFIEYHSSRSKIIFTKLYHIYLLPITFMLVCAHLFWVFKNRITIAFKIVQHLVKGAKKIVSPSDFV